MVRMVYIANLCLCASLPVLSNYRWQFAWCTCSNFAITTNMIRKIADNFHKKLIFIRFNGFCRDFCTEKNVLQVKTRYVCSDLNKIQFLKSFIVLWWRRCSVFLLFFGCFLNFFYRHQILKVIFGCGDFHCFSIEVVFFHFRFEKKFVAKNFNRNQNPKTKIQRQKFKDKKSKVNFAIKINIIPP